MWERQEVQEVLRDDRALIGIAAIQVDESFVDVTVYPLFSATSSAAWVAAAGTAGYGLAMGRLAHGLDPVLARAEVEGPVGAKVGPASSSLHTLQHESPDRSLVVSTAG